MRSLQYSQENRKNIGHYTRNKYKFRGGWNTSIFCGCDTESAETSSTPSSLSSFRFTMKNQTACHIFTKYTYIATRIIP